MKIKEGYLLRKIADTHIVVPTEGRVIEFKGMMVLNSVSAKIWEFMTVDRKYDEIINFVLSTYEIDHQTASRDLNVLLEKMKDNGVLAQ